MAEVYKIIGWNIVFPYNLVQTSGDIVHLCGNNLHF